MESEQPNGNAVHPSVEPSEELSGGPVGGPGDGHSDEPDGPARELSDEAVAFAHQLFDAARGGDLHFVVSAVDQGVPVHLSTATGDSLLMLAAYHGHPDLVAALAARGADVNQLNDRGQSPLAGAVFKRHEKVIRVLVGLEADVDAGQPTARQTAEMFGVELS